MIGELIKDARLKVGMTQDELAAKVGIRAGNVSRLERRDLESCQVRTLRRIAGALGLELVIEMREWGEAGEVEETRLVPFEDL